MIAIVSMEPISRNHIEMSRAVFNFSVFMALPPLQFGLVMFAIYFVTSYYAVGIHATCILKVFLKEEDNMNLWIRWGIFMVYSTVLSLQRGNPFPLADPFVYLFADLYMTDPAARDEVLELGSSFAKGLLNVAQDFSSKQKKQNKKTTDQLNKLNSSVGSSYVTSVSSNKSTVVTGRNVQAIQAPAPITSSTQAMKDANVLNCIGKCKVLDAKDAEKQKKDAETQANKKRKAEEASAKEEAKKRKAEEDKAEKERKEAAREIEKQRKEFARELEKQRKEIAREAEMQQRNVERRDRAAARQIARSFPYART